MEFNPELLKRLRQTQRLVFFTGAGASRESGVPTFREGPNSLWTDFDPSIYATLSGFDNNPAKVWSWYCERRQQLKTLQPNPTHHVIAAWQRKASVTVITQNIDGFHQRAGSMDVIELHGSLLMDKCRDHGHRVAHDFDKPALEHPRCRECNCLLRPDVVWFAEALPEDAYDRAELESYNTEVFISIGCSMEIYPAASLPYAAKGCGAFVIQINPEQTELDGFAVYNLRGQSGEILQALWQAVWQENL